MKVGRRSKRSIEISERMKAYWAKRRVSGVVKDASHKTLIIDGTKISFDPSKVKTIEIA